MLALSSRKIYLHQIGGRAHDDLHDTAHGQADNDGIVATAGPSRKDEDGKFSVGGQKRPVRQTHTIGVAEGQDGGNNIGCTASIVGIRTSQMTLFLPVQDVAQGLWERRCHTQEKSCSPTRM